MSNRKFVENASNAFMSVSIGIGRWTGIANLKKASDKAADDAGANAQAARLYVNLLGSHHDRLRMVNGKFAAVRTYFYENTLPFTVTDGEGQSRGDRIVPVAQVPKFLTRLGELRDAANAALEEFVPEYERLVSIAQSQDMGKWKAEARSKYPTADSVRAKFYCNISPPRPLPSFSPERLAQMSLPMEVAEQIAEQGAAALVAQLEVARKAAIDQAEEHMRVVAKQLKDGVRLHQSLIDNSLHVAAMLRDMAKGYDRDPQAIALADMIEKQVVNVKSTEQWKNSPALQKQAQQIAEKACKGLRDLSNADRSKPAAKPEPKAMPKGKPMARGIMGKKLAAKAGK